MFTCLKRIVLSSVRRHITTMDWNDFKSKILLKKQNLPTTLRTIGTSGPVCNPRVFDLKGRTMEFHIVRNKLFNNMGPKVRDVICLLATSGFGKSRWCDEFVQYINNSSSDAESATIATAISFNTIFGNYCDHKNPDYSIVGRMWPSYFLKNITPTTVEWWIDNLLPMWDRELKLQKILLEYAEMHKPVPSEPVLDALIAKAMREVDLQTAVRVIIADYKQKHRHLKVVRLCLLVDEVSKATANQSAISSKLYSAMDPAHDPANSIDREFSLVMTGLNYNPFFTEEFTTSGRNAFPVYAGPLSEQEGMSVMNDIMEESGGCSIVAESEQGGKASAYLNAYLAGHARSYYWCMQAVKTMAEVPRSHLGKVSVLDVVDTLERNVLAQGLMVRLTEQQLSIGLLFNELPIALVKDNSWLKANVVISDGSLAAVVKGNDVPGTEQRIVISMLPLQLIMAVRSLRGSDQTTFTRTMITQLESILHLSRGHEFTEFANISVASNGLRAEQLVLPARPSAAE